MHILFTLDSLYGESEDGFLNNEEYFACWAFTNFNVSPCIFLIH